MDEIKKAEANGENKTTESTSLIEKALEVAQRLEKANEKQEELVKRQEALAARMVLGGKTEAGFVTQEKPETPSEYAKRILKGKI